jgi:AcrR family transcriptional regulator
MAGQERREAILEAAVKLFSQRGFRGTTTKELAAAVGVSEPVLYQHFETKRDLYAAIIDYKFQQGLDEFSRLLGDAAKKQDDRAFLRALATVIIRWFQEDPAYVRLLLYSALEGHEIAALCYERQASYVHSEIANYLRTRAEQGAIRADLDPLTVARAFMCMIVHYAQSGVLHGLKIDIPTPEYIETAVDIFLRGISITEENKK